MYYQIKHPEIGINCNYLDDNQSHAYGDTVSCFRIFTKDNILQTYLTQEESTTENIGGWRKAVERFLIVFGESFQQELFFCST